MTMRSLVLSAVVFAGVAGVSAPAMAIDVVCESDAGSCAVSNDPVDVVSCGCGDISGTGSTGDDSWAELNEEELLDICLAELQICGPDPGSTTEGTTIGTSVGTSVGTDTEGTDTSDTGSTTDVGTSDTGISEGGTTGTGTTDGDTSGAGTTGGSDDGSSSGVGSASVSATGAEASATDPGSASGDDTSSGSASAGGVGEQSGGCGCNAASEDRSGLLGMAMVLLAGLRVRRRR